MRESRGSRSFDCIFCQHWCTCVLQRALRIRVATCVCNAIAIALKFVCNPLEHQEALERGQHLSLIQMSRWNEFT